MWSILIDLVWNIVVNICFYWPLFIINLLNFLYKVKRTIRYTCKYYILCWAFLLSYLALLLNYWIFLYKVQRAIRYTCKYYIFYWPLLLNYWAFIYILVRINGLKGIHVNIIYYYIHFWYNYWPLLLTIYIFQ